MIQEEHEENNQTVKSFQFCEMKRHKSENVEEWIKRLKIAAKEFEYQEQDRQVKEQFICGLNNECMQRKINIEVKVISKADKITSEQVLLWAKQEESIMTQMLETGQTNGEMIKASTSRYHRSIHPTEDVQHMA